MTRIIEAEGLSKTFRRAVRTPGARAALRSFLRPRHESIDAVRGVTFDVREGERLAFLGANGAGKSTTIKMLTGILHASSGRATVLGLVPWEQRRRLVSRIGCVFGQRSQLWYHLPVAESFELLARVHDLEPARFRARLGELVELFEIGELLDRPVRQLSLGQRMRCEVVSALLHEPRVVFLDEPTIGLDVVSRLRLRELLVRLNERDGVTLFVTSHDAGDVESVCERVLLVSRGELVLDTSVRELSRRRACVRRLEAETAEPAVELALPGVTPLPSDPHHPVFRIDTERTPVDRAIAALLESASVKDLSVSGPRLEAVIASLQEGTAS